MEEEIKIHDLDAELQNNSNTKKDKSSKIIRFILKAKDNFSQSIRRKREERLTLMFIPHNEKKIKSYIISNLTLTIFLGALSIILLISSLVIINHNSTIQEVGKMKTSQKDDKFQFRKIKSEIRKISKSFVDVKKNLNALYSITKGRNKSLFAKGGLEDVKDYGKEDENSIPIEIYMLNRLLDDMKIAELPLQEVYKFMGKRKNIIKNTPTLWPVKGYIINPFGYIRSAHNLKLKFNNGIDIASIPGAEVISTAAGLVLSIKKDIQWGWTVVIRHKFGYETSYKGLERVSVSVNEKVSKNDVIGHLGHPKNSLESILHYEIKVGVEAQNPAPYLNIINQ